MGCTSSRSSREPLVPPTHPFPQGRTKVPDSEAGRRDGGLIPTGLIPTPLTLEHRLLDPTGSPHACQVPLLEPGCQYQMLGRGLQEHRVGGWVGRGAREAVRMWLFPALHPQPLFTGIPRGGAPSRCRGHLHGCSQPTGRGCPPTFASFRSSSFSVTSRLPTLFSRHRSRALRATISVSGSLSFLSCCLSCVCLSCSPGLSVSVPLSLALLSSSYSPNPFSGALLRLDAPNATLILPAMCRVLGMARGDKAPSSLGPPRAASRLQWAALGAVRTSGSPTRARAGAQGPPLRGAPRAPFIMRCL